MKGKIRKVLGVGLALALVAGLSLVVAVPAAAGTLSPVTATSTSYTPGATATYTIGFTTATAGDVKTVDMLFDAGFDVSSAALSTTATNIGVGTVSVSGQTVTYTVTASPPPIISASKAITIKLSGIVNPSTADAYSVVVKTKDADGDLIDKGTATVTIFSPAEVWVDAAVTADGTAQAGTADNTLEVTAAVYASAAVDDAVEFLTGDATDAYPQFTTIASMSGTTLTLAQPGGTGVAAAEGDTFNLINLGGALSGERFRYIGCAVQTVTASTTINVLPGTYKPCGVYTLAGDTTLYGIAILTDGLTLQSTGTTAETIIDASNAAAGYDAIYIQADDVTVDGFTIKDSGGRGIDIVPSHSGVTTSGVTIENNVITNCSQMAINIGGEGHVFTNNTLEASYCGFYLNSGTSDHTITNNTITDSTGTDGAINFEGTNIDDNTITGNTITDGAGAGIHLFAGSTGTGNEISYNNIYDNVEGIDNDSTTYYFKAENNWWGTTVAATIAALMTGSVDYTPWLTAEYGVEEEVTTIDLVAGWNLVSLPLYIPLENRGPATLLADVLANVDIVWGDYDSTTGWKTYDTSAPTNDLTSMRDGKGYWVKMTAADTLDVTDLGTELPLPPEAPPSYGVSEGWNLIGFKSLTEKTASAYLGSAITSATTGTFETMYGYDAVAGTYTTVTTATNLFPGHGYWLAVNADGTIYP